MFNDFKDTEFVLHHKHDSLKFEVGDNVKTIIEKKKKQLFTMIEKYDIIVL